MRIFLGLLATMLLLCSGGCSFWHKHSHSSTRHPATAGTPEASAQAQASVQTQAPAATENLQAQTAPVPENRPIPETHPPTETSADIEPSASIQTDAVEQAPLPPPQPPPARRKPTPPPQPVAAPTGKAQAETLTGKVVLTKEGYRLRLVGDNSKTYYRLTRAKRSREYAAEQIDLRKYYEKTIVVRGKREADWVWSADIMGQWNKPGESRGPNLLAPKMPNR